MSEQVKKIVGHTAPPDFIFKVSLCSEYILFKIDLILFYLQFFIHSHSLTIELKE